MTSGNSWICSALKNATTPYAALRLLTFLLEAGRYDEFIAAITWFYITFIRVKETREHHETMFRTIEPLVREYGALSRKKLNIFPAQSVDSAVCYFVPSLDNDLSHVVQLAALLRSANSRRRRKVYVAGFAEQIDRIGSREIARLARDGFVEIIVLKQSHLALIDFCRWFIETRVGLLIHYSIPTLVPFWIEVFGANRVAWYVTKFELSGFPTLRFGLSGANLDGSQVSRDGGVRWYRSVPSLAPDAIFNYRRSSSHELRLVSVNREQKINDPTFLNIVSELLNKNPSATFSWTGRERSKEIQNFFSDRGVAPRTRFIGWVEPTRVLGEYDIFLDTLSLSGVVAAAAFSSGMPVLFMRGSNSWVEAFENQIKSRWSGIELSHDQRLDTILANSSDDYLHKAQGLINSVHENQFDAVWQCRVGQELFCNSGFAGEQHDRVLSEMLDSASSLVTG